MMDDALDARPVEAARMDALCQHLKSQHFLFVPGQALQGLLRLTQQDIDGFSTYWPSLTLDRYMGDGGTYRYRRYGEFDAPPRTPRRQLPHGPYEQPTYINGLNGGIARNFDPLYPGFVANAVLNRLLDWLTALYDQCEGQPRRWNIRLHPYRILATGAGGGKPTPEGLHRDGVDYIVSMMVARRNVDGGETTLTDNDGLVLWQRTLQQPLDILIGQDALTMHAVSPVSALDPGRQACRDVLVVAFTRVAE